MILCSNYYYCSSVGTCFHTTILAVLHPSSRYYIRYEGRYLVRCTYVGLVTLLRHVCTKKNISSHNTWRLSVYTGRRARIIIYYVLYREHGARTFRQTKPNTHVYECIYNINIMYHVFVCVSLPDR